MYRSFFIAGIGSFEVRPGDSDGRSDGLRIIRDSFRSAFEPHLLVSLDRLKLRIKQQTHGKTFDTVSRSSKTGVSCHIGARGDRSVFP